MLSLPCLLSGHVAKKEKETIMDLYCLWQEQPCNMSIHASVPTKMWCQEGVLCSRSDYTVKATHVISIFAPLRKRHWLGGTRPKINDTTFVTWHLVFIIASRHGASHTNARAHTLTRRHTACANTPLIQYSDLPALASQGKLSGMTGSFQAAFSPVPEGVRPVQGRSYLGKLC